MFVLEGSVALSFLFMREKFKWMITDYNFYSAFNVICQVFGNIFGTYVLNKMLGIPEILMAILGYFSAMLEYIIVGLADYSWELYVGKLLFLCVFSNKILLILGRVQQLINIVNLFLYFSFDSSDAERGRRSNVSCVSSVLGAILWNWKNLLHDHINGITGTDWCSSNLYVNLFWNNLTSFSNQIMTKTHI